MIIDLLLAVVSENEVQMGVGGLEQISVARKQLQLQSLHVHYVCQGVLGSIGEEQVLGGDSGEIVCWRIPGIILPLVLCLPIIIFLKRFFFDTVGLNE